LTTLQDTLSAREQSVTVREEKVKEGEAEIQRMLETEEEKLSEQIQRKYELLSELNAEFDEKCVQIKEIELDKQRVEEKQANLKEFETQLLSKQGERCKELQKLEESFKVKEEDRRVKDEQADAEIEKRLANVKTEEEKLKKDKLN